MKVILPAANVLASPAAPFKPTLQELRVKATTPLRVALVDDHEMVRQGLRWLLEDYEDIRVVGEAKVAGRRSPWPKA